MGEVIELDSRRPHRCGQARCLHCGHEWTAVVPVGVAHFECPSCSMMKGVYKGVSLPDDRILFRCNCAAESFYFVLLPEGYAMCVNCGLCHDSNQLGW